jgi:hypothetical protein
VLGTFETGGMAYSLFVDRQFAYVVSRGEDGSPSKIEIVSLETVSSPKLVGYYDSSQLITDIVVSDQTIFVATLYGLEILEFTAPFNPVRISNYSLRKDSILRNLYYEKERSLVFITNNLEGLAIINVTDTTHPELVVSYQAPISMNVVNLFVKDNYLFLADGQSFGGFGIVDISNITQPFLVSYVALGDGVISLFVEEGVAYVSSYYIPMFLYNVTDPSLPKRSSVYINNWLIPLKIWVNNSRAFIAQYAHGLVAVDVRNSSQPQELATIRDHYSGLCYDVFVKGDYIFIADGWDGLEIYCLIEMDSPQNELLPVIVYTIIGGGLFITVITTVILEEKEKKNQPKNYAKTKQEEK